MCTARPETIDGLWKLDNEWPKSKRLLAIPEQGELIVTTSTAFYRREVLRYLNEILPAYAPAKRKVILYPCAWEKECGCDDAESYAEDAYTNARRG